MVAGAALAVRTINEDDRNRAGLYGLLGSALEAPPSAVWLREVAGLMGDETVLGSAFAALGRSAAATSPLEVAREYHDLFIGVGRGELVPFASYYLTGFLHEKPLAALRADMATLGIERDPSVKEPEDHAAACCQMMAGLIVGAFGVPMELGEQKKFFRKHIGSWMPYFFKDLENSRTSRLYADIGRLGRTFLEVEVGAFEMVE